MLQDLRQHHGYKLKDYRTVESPARMMEIGAWPKRDCLRSTINYHAWFDWSHLFAEDAAKALRSISNAFSSSTLRMSCLLTDGDTEQPTTLRVIEIENKSIGSSYFDAIWDQHSTSLPAPLAAAARIVLVWDTTERWLIVNDRYFEIGLFAILGGTTIAPDIPSVQFLSEPDVLSRFSSVLRINKVVALAELHRWSGRS